MRVPVIVEDKEKRLMPSVGVLDAAGVQIASYALPTGSMLLVREGQPVRRGEVLAKIRRESSKTRDITGGLPRVSELFEARKPKDAAVISEIDGVVHLGKVTRGMKKVKVDGENGESREYQIPQGRLAFYRTDTKCARAIVDRSVSPHVLAGRPDPGSLSDSGVRIDDKHQVIVRQMLLKITIDGRAIRLFRASTSTRSSCARTGAGSRRGESLRYQPLLRDQEAISTNLRLPPLVPGGNYGRASIMGSIDPLRG
jgi:DNA-directed RNA polymerase subunit beta'